MHCFTGAGFADIQQCIHICCAYSIPFAGVRSAAVTVTAVHPRLQWYGLFTAVTAVHALLHCYAVHARCSVCLESLL